MLDSIIGFEGERERAEQFIGTSTTTEFGHVKIYITARTQFVYAQSNFIKKDCKFPTKLATSAQRSLEIIVGNLVASPEDFKERAFYGVFVRAFALTFTYYVEELVLLRPRWSFLDFDALQRVFVVTDDIVVIPLAEWKNRHEGKEHMLSKNSVTINLGAGATFTGPIALGRDIQQSYEAAATASTDALRQELERLVTHVSTLVAALPSDDAKNEVAQQLATFVEQAKKEKPSRELLKVTSTGLIEAARTVAHLVAPVSAAVNAVLGIVGS